MRITFNDFRSQASREMKEKAKLKLMIIGEKVTSEAKKRCPVSTGNLRSSINNQMIRDDTVRIGTNVEYALYIEKGTRKMRAQPFLLPAAYHVLRRG